MSRNKPFPRIFIKQKGCNLLAKRGYERDERYVSSSEANSLVNAARIIIKDFIELTDYIEPVEENKSVFSHRIYELLLRTATEFEANCKGILQANRYHKKEHLDIRDYARLNKIMKLDQYEVSVHFWRAENKIKPFEEWSTSSRLKWYQDYNRVKHNRFKNFSQASLGSLFNGICCLVVILAAQFPTRAGHIYDGFIIDMEENDEIRVKDFLITFPKWNEDELYDFDWNQIKGLPNAFEYYFAQ